MCSSENVRQRVQIVNVFVAGSAAPALLARVAQRESRQSLQIEERGARCHALEHSRQHRLHLAACETEDRALERLGRRDHSVDVRGMRGPSTLQERHLRAEFSEGVGERKRVGNLEAVRVEQHEVRPRVGDASRIGGGVGAGKLDPLRHPGVADHLRQAMHAELVLRGLAAELGRKERQPERLHRRDPGTWRLTGTSVCPR